MGEAMKMLVPFVAALALAGCGAPAATPQVSEAKVRLPAAPGLPAGGYFQLKGFDSMEVLTGATSPAAERIELHLSSSENNISRMQKLDQVSLPRTGEFTFEPGAHHLMLFGLREGLQPGQTIPLTLTFQKAAAVTVEARLEAPGGGGMDGHAGH
jgi:copper(I)-binding protein